MNLLNKWILAGINAVLFMTLISCQAEPIKPASLRLERYAVTAKDFPDGWKFVGEDWSSGTDIERYSVSYGAPSKDGIGLNQTIQLYASISAAQDEYSSQEKEWFSTTKKWEGTEFTPVNSKDDYRYECVQIFMDKSIVSCGFLQRHNEIVVIILINVDGELITFAQLNEILRVLDERLNLIALE